MEIKNFKQLNIYNLLFCLITSGIIFILFKNTTSFNNLLGELNLSEEGYNSKPETCYIYFCRAAIIPYLYYLLLDSLSINIIIYLQIFLLVLFAFLIRNNLINFNLNSWIANFLFLILVLNPKFLKYSFSTQEESFYVPALLLGISTIFLFFLKKNTKNLIYLNLAFALVVLIREAGIIFYIPLILINIHYLIQIDNRDYKKKLYLSVVIISILFSPKIINNSLTNYLNPEKINNHYFSMHALTSLISKQENNLKNIDDNLTRLINDRITKLNNIRKLDNLDRIKRLNFECIIFPAMNNLSYLHPKIINFYKNNYKKNLNKELFSIYMENFFKNPGIFLIKFHECFFGNFLMVELLTKEEMSEMKKILNNSIFDKDDKRIIERFHKISKNYFSVIEPIRFLNYFILFITILSIIISIFSLFKNKNDKFAILSILFFTMYYLVIHLHVNLISVQVRWFFTYYPLLIFSNLKIIELINSFIFKKIFNLNK